jgi:acetolactate synthase-1/3 small subunit
MTIVVRGDDRVLEQVMKQLRKLIDVIKVVDLTRKNIVERELVLVKVSCAGGKRAEIMEIVDIFRGKIVDVDQKIVTIELTGHESKVQALLELMEPFGIQELVRTGKVAIARGSK